MTSPFKKMVLKSSALLFIALVVSKLFGYVFHVLFTKSFSTEEYGLFVYLWYIAMLISSLLLLGGIGAAVARFIPYSRGVGEPKKASDYFKTGFVLTLLLSVFCVLVVLLLNHLSLIPLDSTQFLFICAIVVVQGIGFYFGSVIVGYRKPEVSNINVALGQILKVVFLFSVVYYAAGFRWALLSFTLAFMLGYAFNVVYFLRSYGFSGTFRLNLAKELVHFGVYTVFTDTANNLLYFSSIFFIQYFLGYSVVAIFNAASLISTAGLIFFIAPIEVYAPTVAELLGCGNYSKCSRLSAYLFESFILLCLPPSIVLSLFSGEVLSIVFTPAYAPATTALKLLLLGSFIFGIVMLLRKFIIADGRPKVDTIILGSGAFVNIVLCYLIIPSYGITGAAYASLFSSALMFVLSLRFLGSKIRITISKVRLLKILAAALLGSGVVYYIKAVIEAQIISLATSIIVFCIVYSLVIFALKALRREDVEFVEVVSEKFPLPYAIGKTIVRLLWCAVS